GESPVEALHLPAALQGPGQLRGRLEATRGVRVEATSQGAIDQLRDVRASGMDGRRLLATPVGHRGERRAIQRAWPGRPERPAAPTGGRPASSSNRTPPRE